MMRLQRAWSLMPGGQAAIQYHFGGKEGIYVAFAEEIATRGRAALGPYLSSASVPVGSLTQREVRVALRTLLRSLVQGFVTIAGDGGATREFGLYSTLRIRPERIARWRR